VSLTRPARDARAELNAAFARTFARSYPGVRVSTVGLANPSAVAAYADDMQVHHANVTAALVDDAHRNGLLLGAWAVDPPATMRAIAGLGVDSITTRPTAPAACARSLLRRGSPTPARRGHPPVAQTPRWSLWTWSLPEQPGPGPGTQVGRRAASSSGPLAAKDAPCHTGRCLEARLTALT
jgi:hypothetical protein